MTMLKKEKNKLFDRKLNVFLNINFLNWFKSCVNDMNRSNKSISSIKTRFKVKRKSNQFFEKNMNVLKTSK